MTRTSRSPLGHGRTPRTAESARPEADDGATAVEYALMVGLITLVVSGSVATFGGAVVNLFLIPCATWGPC